MQDAATAWCLVHANASNIVKCKFKKMQRIQSQFAALWNLQEQLEKEKALELGPDPLTFNFFAFLSARYCQIWSEMKQFFPFVEHSSWADSTWERQAAIHRRGWSKGVWQVRPGCRVHQGCCAVFTRFSSCVFHMDDRSGLWKLSWTRVTSLGEMRWSGNHPVLKTSQSCLLFKHWQHLFCTFLAKMLVKMVQACFWLLHQDLQAWCKNFETPRSSPGLSLQYQTMSDDTVIDRPQRPRSSMLQGFFCGENTAWISARFYIACRFIVDRTRHTNCLLTCEHAYWENSVLCLVFVLNGTLHMQHLMWAFARGEQPRSTASRSCWSHRTCAWAFSFL